jgi:hypothetical protein
MKWNDDKTITISPPKKPKKITGTRFAAVQGLNKWNTEFKTWCEITKTYIEPFEDTIYTIAGKTIEPKQADYIEEKYFWEKLVRPADIYGEDYFNIVEYSQELVHETRVALGLGDEEDDEPRADNADKPVKKYNRNKIKYTCPDCGVKVWGKSGLHIECSDCGCSFEEETEEDDDDDDE